MSAASRLRRASSRRARLARGAGGSLAALLVAASLAALGAPGCDAPKPDPRTPTAADLEAARPRKGAGETPTKSDASADPLGPRPTLAAPRSFEPAPPAVFKLDNGMTVWLTSRRTLPLVAVTLALPTGSSADPKGKAGLAHITADMLDEGAGARNAVELSSAINDLGASLSISVSVDGTAVSLAVLKKNFAQAFGLFGDIVVRPRFEAKEWKRVSDLWRNGLHKRADDPEAVSRVVAAAAHFGPETPYGHPPDGLLKDAKSVTLDDAKALYGASFRPERAILVVAGDVTQEEVKAAIAQAFDGWKAKSEATPSAPAAPATSVSASRLPPRLVLVDRPDAPQSVIAVVRAGIEASDPKAPPLDLINTALGGSFTSRLNQNLREDHGWTYGARSAFSETRGKGTFVARAAVRTDVTGPALKELLGELSKMAASGLTPDELMKVLAQDRSELVQDYEAVSSIAARLGGLAMLGLPPSFDAAASRARQAATLPQLAELAKAVDPKDATIVVVGPRAAVVPQLASIGLGEPAIWDAEGAPAAPSEKPAKAK